MFTNLNKTNSNSYFMKLALAQAQKNVGNTKANPSVGCVIVKNGSLISAGSTSYNGRPHAEYNAINFSRENLCDSDLYVTLEPCSHFGKTPPCTKSIIKNKIKKVYFSISDYDPRSRNKCTKILKKKKIIVNKGINSKDVNNFYRSYLKYKTKHLPFVTCKIAVSKDFYTIDKRKKWITNEYSRKRVHLLRSYHDCIITSSKTILKDNSQLTCRINGLENRSPTRVILDKKLSIPLNSRIFLNAKNYRTIIFYNKQDRKKIKLLKKFNIKLYETSLNTEYNLDLNKILIKLKLLGFSRVLLESGLNLTINFLKNNLVDDLKLFISNTNLKKRGRNNIKKYLNLFLANKICFAEKVNLFGEKILSYKIK